jgi:hypothetical protein
MYPSNPLKDTVQVRQKVEGLQIHKLQWNLPAFSKHYLEHAQPLLFCLAVLTKSSFVHVEYSVTCDLELSTMLSYHPKESFEPFF